MSDGYTRQYLAKTRNHDPSDFSLLNTMEKQCTRLAHLYAIIACMQPPTLNNLNMLRQGSLVFSIAILAGMQLGLPS